MESGVVRLRPVIISLSPLLFHDLINKDWFTMLSTGVVFSFSPDNKLVRVIPPLPRLRVTMFPLVGVSSDQKGGGGGGGGGEGKGGVPQKRSDSSRSSKGSVEKFDFIDGEM